MCSEETPEVEDNPHTLKKDSIPCGSWLLGEHDQYADHGNLEYNEQDFLTVVAEAWDRYAELVALSYGFTLSFGLGRVGDGAFNIENIKPSRPERCC